MKAKQIALLFFCALLGVKAFPQEEKKQKRNLWDKFTDLDVSKSMNKMKEDYDESNFNYVISFLDNSAMFEAKEKGTGWKASLINNSGLGGKSAYSFESIAYNHLRQGEMLMKSKRIFLAENSFKLALNNYELAHKSSSNNAAQALGDLALLYQIRGLFEKAIPFCDSAIKIRKGLDNKIMLAVSLNNKGVLLKEMGKYAESEEIYKSGLQLCISEKDDLGKALIYNNLSMLYLSMNKLKDGGLMMDSALANANKSMEPTSTNFIKIEINNAYLHKIRKEYEKAEKIYKDAILIKENKLGKQPDLALLNS
ncbi:MAG: tetratricopeptide repeat protein, partial [Bacteroidia bacterium]